MSVYILLNIGYLLMFIALTVKDILFLRCMLTSAQFIMIGYSILIGNYIVTFWNSVFVILNIYKVIGIIKDRKPIKMEEDILAVYQAHFPIMTRKEFLYFWKLGDKQEPKNGKAIITRGEKLNNLMFITGGKASVRKNFKEVAILNRGNFVAEMSLLTGEAASATVVAQEDLQYMQWTHSLVKKMEMEMPEIWNKILATIGKDLVEKVKMASTK
ncbi:MAG: hypothetical protein A2Y40_07890 [Candidatus Margulisbacteria bacterium GWF2_35_9]|nr:MAG: hypothetical protein A2Y40_07890 [Candidatus Margulisbacteria bacterium GWF2_35_9]